MMHHLDDAQRPTSVVLQVSRWKAARRTWAGILSLTAALLCATPVEAARTATPWLDDAELHGVTFVDPEFGWAVGDRGVILHTQDGGAIWRRQLSSVPCRLNSVMFLNRDLGWAVGGWTHPYTHVTTGVVLFTDDGGRKWVPRGDKHMPALKSVRFFTDLQGVAVGEPSSVFPTGVFTTDNGGKAWRAMPGPASTGWLSGDFLEPNVGVLAGRAGQLAVVRRRSIEPSRIPPIGMRGAQNVRLANDLDGWLVGEGGLVLTTHDLGRTWQLPEARIPDAALEGFNFQALCVQGPRCWIAGSPGTRMLHSPDAGRSWQWWETPTSAPINSVTFVGPNRGWAVGALGTILSTEDGGRTWTKQRAGGTRAAVLGLYAGADDAPLELFTRLSGNEGYLGVVHVIARRDGAGQPPREHSAVDRFHDALVDVGACRGDAAWSFPLPAVDLGWTPGQVVDAWNQANDGGALAKLDAHLVRQIRLWRPDVVFTHGAHPDDPQPLAHLMNQAVLAAVQHAADPTRYPEQAIDAGLKPWKVRKVFGSLPPEVIGDVNVDTAELAARLGRSLADASSGPRGLLERDPTPGRNVWGFHALADDLPQQSGKADFMTGLFLHPGGDARRELSNVSNELLAAQRTQAQRKRSLESIVARSRQTTQGSLRLSGQVGDLVRDMDETMAGQILFQVARQHYAQGHGDLAADTLELLCDRYPEHPLAGKSFIWLVHYWSSGEVAWAAQRGQSMNTGSGGFKFDQSVRPVSGETDPTAQPDDGRFPGGGVMNLMQGSNAAVDDRMLVDRPQKADQIGKWMEKQMPTLYEEPEVRFPLAAVQRKRGYPKSAERFYLNFRQGRSQDAWWACAEGEQWLIKPEGDAPKSVWKCVKTAAKPLLDGDLNDPLWQSLRPQTLTSPLRNDAGWPAKAWLAYDDEFLYFAAECRKTAVLNYEPATGGRTRDPNLADQDRVSLCLDLDRDWATYFRLTVDHRGWAADDCWGDSRWNPTWFIAAGQTPDRWTVECAIPLSELSSQTPGRNTVWGLGVVRTAPKVGFQSFSFPASPSMTPEGFGYLLFE